MRTPSATLTAQELEIMKVIWRLERATVREAYEDILQRRKVAYTTVMTMMKILEQKGYLLKAEGEKAHIYRPARPRRQVIGGMVKEFINRVFDGSAEPLLAHLVEDRHLSEHELEEIARMRRRK